MGDRVNREEIERANDIHILDYLNSKGELLIRQGKYYRHADHDSLIIHKNGKWFWNSKGQGGYGSISFARTFYDFTFQEAVRDVNGLSINRSFTNNMNKEEAMDFVYPKHYETTTQKNVRQYLVNERMIDEKTVDFLIRNDYVAEDKLKNCVFKWKDSNGEIVGADRQGTVRMDTNRGYFKQVLSNSKEDGGFKIDVGIPNKIALFESPIDAISYLELHKPQDIRLQSMSGLKDRTAATAIKDLMKECREQNMEVEKVIFAVDNDKAGKKFIKRWENMLSVGIVHTPKYKDWNIDLKQKKEKLKQKEQEIKLER